MAGRRCEDHSPAFNANVAVAAIKGEKTLIALAGTGYRRNLPAPFCLV